ncbi:GNAT family acetyltransferase [Methylobacterium nodulans]|uniref:GCN5-related N-acetyltransferase n=1 Tax=Methylobacterium nodulans (strain LMG 21967 / CNCM I-2342 / ORS 2060) TaxID=460265 RepID=B8IUT3_METNO|nr:GNAT family acetyltransferase [Methylobacterium nodulans]ACL57151.1 GCN5-related N-acetyltransferase [Methylobacterium nodulans ORS 2060]
MPSLVARVSDPGVIREIRDGDEAALIALWHAAGVSRPWNDPQRDIAFARGSPHATILVAQAGDVLVASAMVGEDGHRGWAYYVAVAPERQKTGLGRAIMQAAEIWLLRRGIWKLQLLVRADNAGAVGFYERLGYHDTRTVCLQKVIEPAA